MIQVMKTVTLFSCQTNMKASLFLCEVIGFPNLRVCVCVLQYPKTPCCFQELLGRSELSASCACSSCAKCLFRTKTTCDVTNAVINPSARHPGNVNTLDTCYCKFYTIK